MTNREKRIEKALRHALSFLEVEKPSNYVAIPGWATFDSVIAEGRAALVPDPPQFLAPDGSISASSISLPAQMFPLKLTSQKPQGDPS